jgi:hypothetical protein
MGNALFIQSSIIGAKSLLAGAFGGSRAIHSRVSRACLHTTRSTAAGHAPLRKEDSKLQYFFNLLSRILTWGY